MHRKHVVVALLGRMMPGTSLVESDFTSLIDWTRDPHLKPLADFSLESILTLQKIKTWRVCLQSNKFINGKN
jgi:hypothetical protein